MIIRIVEENRIWGGKSYLPVGLELELGGHPPAGWAGAYVVVSEDKKKGKTAVTNPEDTPSPLDHDGDGKDGGSLPGSPDEELQALRDEYEELSGEKPHHARKKEWLEEQIAELKGE